MASFSSNNSDAYDNTLPTSETLAALYAHTEQLISELVQTEPRSSSLIVTDQCNKNNKDNVDQSWPCHQCTFVNHEQSNTMSCAVCLTARQSATDVPKTSSLTTFPQQHRRHLDFGYIVDTNLRASTEEMYYNSSLSPNDCQELVNQGIDFSMFQEYLKSAKQEGMDYDFDMVKAFNSTTMERLDGINQHNIHTWKSKILKWSNRHLIHALVEVAPHTDDSAIAVALGTEFDQASNGQESDQILIDSIE